MWIDPNTHQYPKLTQTALLQGFWGRHSLQTWSAFTLSSPACFSRYMASSFTLFPSDSQSNIVSLLSFLNSRGYWVSPSKAQHFSPQVTHLVSSFTPTHEHLPLGHVAHLHSLSLCLQHNLNCSAFGGWPISSAHGSLDIHLWYILYIKLLLDLPKSLFLPLTNNPLN